MEKSMVKMARMASQIVNMLFYYQNYQQRGFIHENQSQPTAIEPVEVNIVAN